MDQVWQFPADDLAGQVHEHFLGVDEVSVAGGHGTGKGEEFALRHRDSPGVDGEAPGRADFARFPGQPAAVRHGGVIEDGEGTGAAAADIVRQESEGPAGGRGVPVGPGKLGHVPDEAVVRGHRTRPITRSRG